MGKTNDPDGCGAIAEQAYGIYRGMIMEASDRPKHWDDLTRQERGLLTWTARFARMQPNTTKD